MPWGNQKGSHTYSFDLKIACYGSSPCTSTFRICCTFCTIYHHISPLKKMARTKSYANPCAEICRFRGFSRFRAKMLRITGAETHTFPAQLFHGPHEVCEGLLPQISVKRTMKQIVCHTRGEGPHLVYRPSLHGG